jgi:hypothetical protein
MSKRPSSTRRRKSPPRKTKNAAGARKARRSPAAVRRAVRPTTAATIPLEQLVDLTASDLRKILARKTVRDLLWTMAHHDEEGRGPIARSSHRSDEARIARRAMNTRVKTTAVTRSSLRCFWYNFYMEVVKPVYGFRHLGAVHDQRGDVVSLGDNGRFADDGDFTFAITRLDPPRSHETAAFTTLHCEITPCNRQALMPFIAQLRHATLPVRVSLDGTLSFDPAHQGEPDVLEIHPVLGARFIG